jgi:hypothetical protein
MGAGGGPFVTVESLVTCIPGRATTDLGDLIEIAIDHQLGGGKVCVDLLGGAGTEATAHFAGHEAEEHRADHPLSPGHVGLGYRPLAEGFIDQISHHECAEINRGRLPQLGGGFRSGRARLAALTTAWSEASRMLESIPTPHQVDPPGPSAST